MGADEKHAATYHGLSNDTVRGRYCDGTHAQTGHTTDGAEYDTWLAGVKAEAKAEALNEVADEWERLMKIGKQMFAETTREDNAAFDDWAGQEKPGWLRARANQYKETP